MSRASDKAIEASMGRRRPREAIQAEVAESILGEMVPAGVIEVPIESLFKSPHQVRTMGSEDEIDKLAESIQSAGLISPIVVRPLRSPDPSRRLVSSETVENLQCKFFEVVTGHHRVLACLKLGWLAIPVVVRNMTDIEAAIALTADNTVKKDLTDWDRFQHMLMLKDVGACKTGRELAATLGVSTAQITQLQAFSKLPDAALDAISRAPAKVGYRLVYDLVNDGLVFSHPELVSEALDRLVSDETRTQASVIPWINLQLASKAPRHYRRELQVDRPGMQRIKIVVTEKGAQIAAKGLDPEKLAALLEANLANIST